MLLLGYRSNDFKIFGSASIFFVPINTNNGGTAFICAVTALHNLKDKETEDPLDGLYLKMSPQQNLWVNSPGSGSRPNV